MSKERLTARQRTLIDWLSVDTPGLVSYYLREGGIPFDFRGIYYESTGRFDYSSIQAVALRRTLRMMEQKGLLRRGQVESEIRDDIIAMVCHMAQARVI